MESLFNITWAILAVSGIAAGLLWQQHLAGDGKRELARNLVLLALVALLLLPVISLSDDIGYFSYYFSRGQAPDGTFWVSGLRREKDLPALSLLQACAFLLAALVGCLSLKNRYEAIPSAAPLRLRSRRTAPIGLRAPPTYLS